MLKCIIIDDLSKDAQVLKSYIRRNPSLEYLATYPDSKDALLSLKSEPADLIFLEVKKVQMAGSPSISVFQSSALVILISVNGKSALDGFENDVVDFLIKPFIYSRFFKAVEKAYRIKFSAHENVFTQQAQLKGGYVFIKEATRLLRVELDDIYYVMGLKNYVSILTKTQRIVSLQTMKQMEELLPPKRFVRVHRSYFVAVDKIISVEKQQIQIKDKMIPIGNVYLSLFMKKITNSGY